MRTYPLALVLTLCLALCLAGVSPVLADEPKTQAAQSLPANAPKTADVLEYIRLFGYRQMLMVNAEQQLASVIEMVRLSRDDLAPGVLEVIHKELRSELGPAADRSVLEMARVFQRHFTREDVAYLLSVGRDPRMQKVVRQQPAIAKDMEAIGERLAEGITAKAAPRIEERLKKLEGGQEL